jgi:hypothetical protein
VLRAVRGTGSAGSGRIGNHDDGDGQSVRPAGYPAGYRGLPHARGGEPQGSRTARDARPGREASRDQRARGQSRST